jgi:phosphoribosyl 1,2-cyclic phosphodiesterase
MGILTWSLQSGSNGNSIYVETADARLLFDAGISGKQAADRMACHGRDIRDCDAVIISHDHADHVRAAGIYSRKFDLPVLVSRPTFMSVQGSLGAIGEMRHFRPGDQLPFGRTTVETVPTPHDGVDGAAFIVCRGNWRLGILTDLGHVFAGLADLVGGLDAAYLETNYDPAMLRNGPYPKWLQQRIAGPGGHLSNNEAGKLANDSGRKLRWLALAHLSEENNRPDLALRTVTKSLDRKLPLHVASRYEVGPRLEL